jgi:hypothetical protein
VSVVRRQRHTEFPLAPASWKVERTSYETLTYRKAKVTFKLMNGR